MNDIKNGTLVMRDIDLLIKNLNDTWSEFNNKDLNMLKEAWISESCIEYIDKFKNADNKMKEIINRLYFLKTCWEKYINSQSANNIPKGDIKNE